jgi:hypothetical protein
VAQDGKFAFVFPFGNNKKTALYENALTGIEIVLCSRPSHRVTKNEPVGLRLPFSITARGY